MIERILITFHPDGTFRGAASYVMNGEATPMSEEALAELSSPIELAALAENERLRLAHAAEIAALSAGQVTPSPLLLTALDNAFETLIPAELQPQFELAWTTVRNLIQAGKIARAATFVRSIAVPAELIPIRTQIADLIDGGE